MSEKDVMAQAQEQENGANVEAEQQQEISQDQPKQDTDKLFARMKSAEEEKKELKGQLNELLQKEKERQDAKLVEEGDYKKLLDAKEVEMKDLASKADRADSLNGIVQAIFDKKLESISEEKRGMIPHQDDPVKALEYINQWEDQLIDAPKGSTAPSTPKSTTNPADDVEIARQKLNAFKEQMATRGRLSDAQQAEYVRLSEEVGRI